jgi:hypothetical protein
MKFSLLIPVYFFKKKLLTTQNFSNSLGKTLDVTRCKVHKEPKADALNHALKRNEQTFRNKILKYHRNS